MYYWLIWLTFKRGSCSFERSETHALEREDRKKKPERPRIEELIVYHLAGFNIEFKKQVISQEHPRCRCLIYARNLAAYLSLAMNFKEYKWFYY